MQRKLFVTVRKVYLQNYALINCRIKCCYNLMSFLIRKSANVACKKWLLCFLHEHFLKEELKLCQKGKKERCKFEMQCNLERCTPLTLQRLLNLRVYFSLLSRNAFLLVNHSGPFSNGEYCLEALVIPDYQSHFVFYIQFLAE